MVKAQSNLRQGSTEHYAGVYSGVNIRETADNHSGGGGVREPDPWGRVKRAWSQEQGLWSRELKVCTIDIGENKDKSCP